MTSLSVSLNNKLYGSQDPTIYFIIIFLLINLVPGTGHFGRKGYRNCERMEESFINFFFYQYLKKLNCDFYEKAGSCLNSGIGLNTFSIWYSKCDLMHVKRIFYKKWQYHRSSCPLKINNNTAICIDKHHCVHNPGWNVMLMPCLIYRAQSKTSRNF